MFQEINKKLISTYKMVIEALNKLLKTLYLFVIKKGFYCPS